MALHERRWIAKTSGVHSRLENASPKQGGEQRCGGYPSKRVAAVIKILSKRSRSSDQNSFEICLQQRKKSPTPQKKLTAVITIRHSTYMGQKPYTLWMPADSTRSTCSTHQLHMCYTKSKQLTPVTTHGRQSAGAGVVLPMLSLVASCLGSRTEAFRG